jgi:signal peptidase I
MFDKWMQYSYAAQKHQRHRVLKFILIFFVLYVAYNCFTAFFFSVWVVENDTMQSALSSGDRIIFTSFTPPWSGSKYDEANLQFKRGSIVLIDKRHERDINMPLQIIDGIVRFFTAQRISILSGDGQFYIKRVIALPGDEISMNNYVFRVRTGALHGDGSSFNLTEFELSGIPYHPIIPQTHGLWDQSIPFSGHMDPILLGSDECFVVSDDRSSTNDSRTWGPIPTSLIKARAVVRIWPLNKIELF